MTDLLAAHRHTVNNRAEVEASRLCGCCNCLQTFAPAEVVAFTGLDFNQFNNPDAAPAAEAETALCPRCGSEAVIGDRSGYAPTPQFLGRMNEAWFQRTIVRRPAPRG